MLKGPFLVDGNSKWVYNNYRVKERKVIQMKKLSNRNKLEMLIGKLVILLVESAIGCALILGFFWLVGFITSWAEQSTLRMIIFFVVMGIIIAKQLKNELK